MGARETCMPLNGTPAEVQELRERMMQQRAAGKGQEGPEEGRQDQRSCCGSCDCQRCC